MKKILMGSIILSVFAATLMLVQMSSCTKTGASTSIIHDTVRITTVDTVCPTPKYPITGLWIGTYTVPSLVQGQFYYSFAIYPDNTILIKSKGADGNTYYSSGTWALSGNAFSATFTTINRSDTQVTQSVTATFSDVGILTNGIEFNTANPTNYPATLSIMQRIN